MIYRISKNDRSLKGVISLSGSKSISNRVLIIEALCGHTIDKSNLATANDTLLLQQLLANGSNSYDAQDAGTAFRFLTAYLSWKQGDFLLTGTPRMQQRPVSDLVDALRMLGVVINYTGKEGFPPLQIHGGSITGNQVTVHAGVSSQFVSALLLIAPCLPQGLTITITGRIVSAPYIDMTLAVMEHFGVKHKRSAGTISVAPQLYEPRQIFIESDWSAASYYYEMAALAQQADITLTGLTEKSFQGDAQIVRLMQPFGVTTAYGKEQISITRNQEQGEKSFHLLQYPDLAPALFAAAAGSSAQAVFTGLEHLAYKESNRENAMRNELAKCGIRLINKEGVLQTEGNFAAGLPRFSTYSDHRMAMALAPLALVCGAVEIENPEVVNKSYPGYWSDLKKLGFVITEV